MAEFMIICLVIGICYAVGKASQDGCESSGDRRRGSYQGSRSTRSSRSSSPPQRSSRPVYATPFDRASSPVGGTCMNCGVLIEEETSRQCPICGAERQRCPICQRFIAGGQELMGCPYCKMLGHKNEIITWVEQKGSCPHCGSQINTSMLISPDKIINSEGTGN